MPLLLRLLYLCSLCLLATSCREKKPAHPLEQFTGAPTKVVWARDMHKSQHDTHLHGDRHQLWGLDTRGSGEPMAILTKVASYSRPLITPDGKKILFSSKKVTKTKGSGFQARYTLACHVYQVNWDGSGLQKLGRGFATDIWRDPETGRDWVYAGRKIWRQLNLFASELVRFPLDDPKQIEIVWSDGLMSLNNVQISRDGKYACGLFPWPSAGLLDLEKGTWKKMRNGCWTSMAPDNSHLMWVFDGAHRNLYFFQPDKTRWAVNINQAPGIDGYEVYHPRWTNHPRYFAMTGPYKAGRGGNQVSAGGKEVDLYIGRFNSHLTDVEDWYRLTDNDRADFAPDVWIKGAHKVSLDRKILGPKRAQKRVENDAPIELSEQWPASTQSLVFLWENANAANDIVTTDAQGKSKRTQIRLTERQYARYGRHGEMLLGGGSIVADEATSRAIVEACRTGDAFSLEVVLTPSQIANPKPQRILSLSQSADERNLSLDQIADKIYLSVRTVSTGLNAEDSRALVAKVQPGEPLHLILTYRRGSLTIYRNGELKVAKKVIHNRLTNWTPQKLIFGDEWGGGFDWDGSLENIALYSRRLEKDQMEKHAAIIAQQLAARKPVETLLVRAKLLETTPTPRVADIGQYTRSLAIYRYQIEKVLEGEYAEDEIHVLHWVIMDREALPFLPPREGESFTLTLQKFSDHPQLEGESRDEPDDFDIELYYDIGAPNQWEKNE